MDRNSIMIARNAGEARVEIDAALAQCRTMEDLLTLKFDRVWLRETLPIGYDFSLGLPEGWHTVSLSTDKYLAVFQQRCRAKLLSDWEQTQKHRIINRAIVEADMAIARMYKERGMGVFNIPTVESHFTRKVQNEAVAAGLMEY